MSLRCCCSSSDASPTYPSSSCSPDCCCFVWPMFCNSNRHFFPGGAFWPLWSSNHRLMEAWSSKRGCPFSAHGAIDNDTSNTWRSDISINQPLDFDISSTLMFRHIELSIFWHISFRYSDISNIWCFNVSNMQYFLFRRINRSIPQCVPFLFCNYRNVETFDTRIQTMHRYLDIRDIESSIFRYINRSIFWYV